MKSTLVIGGEKSFVETKLASQLRAHGLRIDKAWTWDKQAGTFPDQTEVVFVLTDMAGHRLNDPAVDEAKSRNIPIIYGGRKYAHNIERLTTAGFPVMSTPKETVDMSTVLRKAPALPSFPTVQAALPLPIKHSPRVAALGTGTLRTMYDRFLPYLAQNPGASNKGLAEVFDFPYGSCGEPGRCARETLGLTLDKMSGNMAMLIDRPVYEAVCAAIGVQPVEGAKVTKEAIYPPKEEITRPAKKPITERTQKSKLPVVATVEAASVPPAVRADFEASEHARKTDLGDLKDLVLLLRVEMQKRNITKLVITPDAADATKTVVVNESLGI